MQNMMSSPRSVTVVSPTDTPNSPEVENAEKVSSPLSSISLNSHNSLSPVRTSISIGHVFVYNFKESTPKRNSYSKSLPISSASSSSGIFCRICHEGDGLEELVSPCNCTGTLGLVHISCMEKWLGASNTDRCEICQFVFAIQRSPRPFKDWVESSANSEYRRSLLADLACFLFLTPLALISGFLCIDGARQQSLYKNHLETGCLISLAVFLLVLYCVWSTLTIRYHYKSWKSWRKINCKVKLLSVRQINELPSNCPRQSTHEELMEENNSPFITPDRTPNRPSSDTILSADGKASNHTLQELRVVLPMVGSDKSVHLGNMPAYL